MFTRSKKILAGLFAVGSMAVVAQANTIYLTATTVTGTPNNYTFTYDVTLQANTLGFDSVLHDTSSFELLDYLPSSSISGITYTLVSNADWALTTTTANTYPGNPDPSFEDIKLTYTGATNYTATTGVPVVLGTISISTNVQSPLLTRTVKYNSNDWETNNGGATYASAANTNNTLAPGVLVPLPASALGGMGLMGVLGAAQLIRRRSMSR